MTAIIAQAGMLLSSASSEVEQPRLPHAIMLRARAILQQSEDMTLYRHRHHCTVFCSTREKLYIEHVTLAS